MTANDDKLGGRGFAPASAPGDRKRQPGSPAHRDSVLANLQAFGETSSAFARSIPSQFHHFDVTPRVHGDQFVPRRDASSNRRPQAPKPANGDSPPARGVLRIRDHRIIAVDDRRHPARRTRLELTEPSKPRASAHHLCLVGDFNHGRVPAWKMRKLTLYALSIRPPPAASF